MKGGPSAPPPLIAMAALLEQRQAERRRTFVTWKAALEGAAGNVTRAATAMGKPRSAGRRLTERLGLTVYAAVLRAAAGQLVGRGRPRKGRKDKKAP